LATDDAVLISIRRDVDDVAAVVFVEEVAVLLARLSVNAARG